MAALEEAVTCVVCLEVYQANTRDPLVLPCGHTFCRSCLSSIYGSHSSACPSCRENFSYLDFEELPICFSLLSLSSNYIDFQQYNMCTEHQGDLMYWCRGCQQPLCGLCLYYNHPPGHDVQLANTCLQEKKQALLEQVKMFHQGLNKKKKEIKETISSYIMKIKGLCQIHKTIQDVEAEMAALSNEAEGAYSINNILYSEAKIKSALGKTYFFSSGDDGSEHENKIEENCSAMSNTVTGDSLDDTAVGQQQSPSGGRQVAANRSYARLDCQDGRLLLSSFSSCNDTHLFFQLPSEVFLELSAGNHCLGRVYIQLWCHLRRAQHFRALCLGSLGPSYVGATFIVSYLNKERETLDVREYMLPDGSTSNKVLMTDLEWGGKFAGPAKEGTITGSYYGLDTHGFGICTRSHPGGTFQCPFGEVLSGMEVVQAAIHHEPVSEVTITDCGLVIPELKP